MDFSDTYTSTRAMRDLSRDTRYPFPWHAKEVLAETFARKKAQGDSERSEFIERSNLSPPETMRMIDCKSTVQERARVILIDRKDQPLISYTAISHTCGSDDVYRVFDCECSANCLAKVPRCSSAPCRGHTSHGDRHHKIVEDILKMCEILSDAGVDYAWHDGVCIAQHDKAKVEETVAHMGWIYANAKETIIFPDYVGEPMAPIRLDGNLVSRWQTRVWTLQEAALSKRRRYCVRLGGDLRCDSQSSQELIEKIYKWCQDCDNAYEFAIGIFQWYKDDSTIRVIEEDAFWTLIQCLIVVILVISDDSIIDEYMLILRQWISCLLDWNVTLGSTCLLFPTFSEALRVCSIRDCSFKGDRINSILTLSGVTDFVAPKDGNMEVSTLEFFKRQNHRGLATALFMTNVTWTRHRWHHTWVPILSSPLTSGLRKGLGDVSSFADYITCEVQADGNFQLKGPLACLPVQFTLREGGTTQEPRDGRFRLAMDLRYDSNSDFLASTGVLEAGEASIPTSSRTQGQPVVQGREITFGDSFCTHLVFPARNLDLEVFKSCLADETRLHDLNVALLQAHGVSAGEYADDKSATCTPPRFGPVTMSVKLKHERLPGKFATSSVKVKPGSYSPYKFGVPGLLVQGDLEGHVSKIGCFSLNQGLIGFLIVFGSIANLSVIENLIIR